MADTEAVCQFLSDQMLPREDSAVENIGQQRLDDRPSTLAVVTFQSFRRSWHFSIRDTHRNGNACDHTTVTEFGQVDSIESRQDSAEVSGACKIFQTIEKT